MSEKKERPILFSTPMVQALLNGTKTQTRRIIKEQPKQNQQYGQATVLNGTDKKVWILGVKGELHCDVINCPYGAVGDKLYVKETFLEDDGEIFYKADMDNSDQEYHKGSWRPSLFMKKEYARIFLEIQEINIELLNIISEENAEFEGIKKRKPDSHDCFDPMSKITNLKMDYIKKGMMQITAKESFQSLWQSINGIDSWDKNPWVWVVKFKVVKA